MLLVQPAVLAKPVFHEPCVGTEHSSQREQQQQQDQARARKENEHCGDPFLKGMETEMDAIREGPMETV
jgi:hypothetical protein